MRERKVCGGVRVNTPIDVRFFDVSKVANVRRQEHSGNPPHQSIEAKPRLARTHFGCTCWF